MFNEIILPIAALGGLGLILGIGLAVASKLLAVKIDPKIEKVRELLPGANCGACGYPGCDGFAKATSEGVAQIGACTVLSEDDLNEIAQLLGVEAKLGNRRVARVLCRGDEENCASKFEYFGVSDCRAAAMLAGGPASCRFACVGMLTCAKVCPFDAIYLNEHGIAEVNEAKCTGCGRCVVACPKDAIEVMDESNRAYINCRNIDKGKEVTSVCKAGCFGCSLCEKRCPQGAITMVNNLPLYDYDKCTDCGVCAVVCPKGSIALKTPTTQTAVIYEDPCDGCGICKTVCPTRAIKGEQGELHVVNPDKCAACNICVEKCPTKAIELCDK